MKTPDHICGGMFDNTCEACYEEQLQRDSRREELPVGESRYDTYGEPDEWDVQGGLMNAKELFSRPIDNGFYAISYHDAKELAGKLPASGMEKLVLFEGKTYWLTRTNMTLSDGTVGRVWSIRSAGEWKLKDGKAVL